MAYQSTITRTTNWFDQIHSQAYTELFNYGVFIFKVQDRPKLKVKQILHSEPGRLMQRQIAFQGPWWTAHYPSVKQNPPQYGSSDCSLPRWSPTQATKQDRWRAGAGLERSYRQRSSQPCTASCRLVLFYYDPSDEEHTYRGTSWVKTAFVWSSTAQLQTLLTSSHINAQQWIMNCTLRKWLDQPPSQAELWH